MGEPRIRAGHMVGTVLARAGHRRASRKSLPRGSPRLRVRRPRDRAEVLHDRSGYRWEELRRAARAHPCRLCGGRVEHAFVDLGISPLCESFLSPNQLGAMEPYFPLRVGVCSDCFLVQLNEHVRPEHIVNEYAYFSSYSTTWVAQ
jgi:hypothetical protein